MHATVLPAAGYVPDEVLLPLLQKEQYAVNCIFMPLLPLRSVSSDLLPDDEEEDEDEPLLPFDELPLLLFDELPDEPELFLVVVFFVVSFGFSGST